MCLGPSWPSEILFWFFQTELWSAGVSDLIKKKKSLRIGVFILSPFSFKFYFQRCYWWKLLGDKVCKCPPRLFRDTIHRSLKNTVIFSISSQRFGINQSFLLLMHLWSLMWIKLLYPCLKQILLLCESIPLHSDYWIELNVIGSDHVLVCRIIIQESSYFWLSPISIFLLYFTFNFSPKTYRSVH